MDGPSFEVRRSRPHLAMQIAVAAALLLVALGNLVNLYRTGQLAGGPLVASGFFAAIMAFYAWNLLAQYRDRRPQIVIGPAGLHLPTVLPEPVPWSHVWKVIPPSGMMSRTRLDIDIAPDIYVKMKLGQRFTGENIVRRKGLGGGMSIYTMGYEHNARELADAIRRYWPPPTPGDDEED